MTKIHKFTPFKHQRKSLAMALATSCVYDCSSPGCVSANTEFLTPAGWKRIDEYADGDLVAQFHPAARTTEFVEPLAYVKKPCAEMIHIAPARGTSQQLSPEHRVLYYNPDGSHAVCSAAEFMHELHERGANHLHRKFCTTFSVVGTAGIELTYEQIRVMVAVIADGHFNRNTPRCVIRVKKERKIERLRRLLAQAQIVYSERTCNGAPEFQVFTFDAPVREKEFGASWWGATQAQLEVVADELPHWDGTVRKGNRGVGFSSYSEASADFAQYAFSAAKLTTSLARYYRNRTASGRGVAVEYAVVARGTEGLVGPGRASSVYVAPNPEGFKYCFEVPSSFLLLRHNGYIFATGNTGKTAVAIWAYEARLKKKQAKKALVLAPKSLLRSVWANDIKKFAPGLRVSVSTAGKHEQSFAADADVYVTNIDAVKWLVKQKPAFFKGFDELIIDECFPAGTLVDTPCGPRPIETIKTGEAVNTSSGPLPVTNTFVSESSFLVRLEIENGTEIYCTENHPIATSEGWRKAGDCDGMFTVQLSIHQFSQPGTALLQSEVCENGILGKCVSERNSCANSENVQGSTRAPFMEQRGPMCGRDQGQNTLGAHGFGAQTKGLGGQRQGEPARDDGGGDASENLDTPVHDSHKTAEGQRVPTQLQARLCEPSIEENSGDRRKIAHVAQVLGCEERFILGFARVVGVSRHKLRNPVDVYNLQVDGPHDYSVASTLVHNCTAYKHSTSQRSKAVAKIAKNFKFRRAMTGTPNSNSITDVWHQVKILDDGKRLGSSFFAFRAAVCTPVQRGFNMNAVEWVDKDGAEEAVFSMLDDIVIRHKFEDCVDIPENHQYCVPYELSPAQRKTYETMRDLQVAELHGTADDQIKARLKGTKPKSSGVLMAINAAAVATKLLQIASGAVYEKPDKFHVVDTGRYEMILDLVEAREHSLVFFLWKHQRDLLLAEAEKRGITFALIDGSVPETERDTIVKQYQAGMFRVLFAHPKSAAHGLTLTRGTATIWASPTYDLEIFAQGSKRQYRMGQTQKTETIVVTATDTIDTDVYDRMLAKNARMTNLLDLFSTV